MPKVSNTHSFIEKASKLHNDKYDYSLVEYGKNNTKKVKIICPEHGQFLIAPKSHLLGTGCTKCSNMYRKSFEDFLELATKKHNNKYKYFKNSFISNSKKVQIECPIHGIFFQAANIHLTGVGCSKCARIENAKNNSIKHGLLFFERAVKVHKDKYNYDFVEYKTTDTKVDIQCNQCHTIFKQTPANHLNGCGCPKCNTYGYRKSQFLSYCKNKKDAEPKIYIIHCFSNKEDFIKIGLTADPIYKRFKTTILMPYYYEVLKEIKGSPDFVWDKEKELHRLYKPFKYKPLISFAGASECFNMDVMKNIL